MIPLPQRNHSTVQLQPYGTAFDAEKSVSTAGLDNDEDENAEPLNICSSTKDAISSPEK